MNVGDVCYSLVNFRQTPLMPSDSDDDVVVDAVLAITTIYTMFTYIIIVRYNVKLYRRTMQIQLNLIR